MTEQLEKLAEIRFQSSPQQLQDVRRVVRSVTKGLGCGNDLANCMVLAVDEACSNVIKHAYGGDDSGDIVLEIFSNRAELVFRLTNFAKPVDRTACRSRALDDSMTLYIVSLQHNY